MMSNVSADALFQLVKSFEKSEKRHFKLYIKRSSANTDLKIIQLFDALDTLQEYDERLLIKKLSPISKSQLSNLKTHLNKQLLASLRLLKTTENVDLQLSEHLDNARLLYNKGLILQALKMIEKAKTIAKANHKVNFLIQLLSLEKKIETLHITRTTQDKAEKITQESSDISAHIDRATRFSNLALLLYRWYIRHGSARNEKDEKELKKFFKENLPEDLNNITDFYEKLYLYQSYSWLAFIRQDFLMYYRYGQKWIDLFNEQPLMMSVETGHYIKGMHNLLNAHFDLRNFKKFKETLKSFEEFSVSEAGNKNDNFRIHTFIYIYSAKINWHIMNGTFKEGLLLVPHIKSKLQEFQSYIDNHRNLVFNYKIATLYFGNADFDTAIDYLQKIIHDKPELRSDLQSYARLLHLIAHFELGNTVILESLMKSVYRFMAKMKNLTEVEEEIFRFLRNTLKVSYNSEKDELKIFYERIKDLERKRYEMRSFVYFDIVSWLESKLQNKSMSEIIYTKYVSGNKRL